MLIADTGNNRGPGRGRASTGTFYGQAMTAGDIYTIAGNGTSGTRGDGGPATAPSSTPAAAWRWTRRGRGDRRQRQQRGPLRAGATGTFYGQSMTAGDIYTIAGNGTAGYSGDGGPATSAELDYPDGVAVDAAGRRPDRRHGQQRRAVRAGGTRYLLRPVDDRR